MEVAGEEQAPLLPQVLYCMGYIPYNEYQRLTTKRGHHSQFSICSVSQGMQISKRSGH